MTEPLIYVRGDEKPIRLAIKDRDGNPVLPAGHIVRFTAKPAAGYPGAPDAAAIFRKSTADGGIAFVGEVDGYGVYHVLPQRSETEGLLETTPLAFDVEIEPIATGKPETADLAEDPDEDQVVGHMVVVADVTRGV